MICPEAREKLQEVFTWWKDHVTNHNCLGCGVARWALIMQSKVVQLLRGQGVNV